MKLGLGQDRSMDIFAVGAKDMWANYLGDHQPGQRKLDTKIAARHVVHTGRVIGSSM